MGTNDLFGGLPLLGEPSAEEATPDLDSLDLGGDMSDGEGLGLDGLDFADDIASMGFKDDEEDELDGLTLGADLLFSEDDISTLAFDYYNSVKNVLDKIQPPTNTDADNFKLSSSDFPYLESKYLSAVQLAILDQAKAQSELKPNARMSPEDNAEAIFDALSSAMPFPIGANYGAFIEMCARKYENFLKLVSVSTAQATTKFEQLLDRERINQAQFTFAINGLLWHQISIYLNDERINRNVRVNYTSNGRQIYFCGVIGSAMEAYNDYLRSTGARPVDMSSITVGTLLDCINYMLSPQNMSSTLHLSQDDVISLSIGELLRRYLLLEKDEDIFDMSLFNPVSGFPQITSTTATDFERVNVQFSADMQQRLGQLTPLYAFLRAPFYKEGRETITYHTDSIVHEILYYIYLVLELGLDDRKEEVRAAYEYLMLLTPFMISLMLNAPYVHPVLYYTPNPIPGSDNEFELNYYIGGRYYSVHENGLLINVVGDQRSAYLIPFVAVVDRTSRNVVALDDSGEDGVRAQCPPCVVMPFHQLFTDLQVATKSAGAASKKMKIDGTTEYCYTPSLAWVVSRSYSSQQDVDNALEGDAHSSRTTNPLLNTLLNYTNSFAPEATPVVAGIALMDNGLSALYVKQGVSSDGGDARLISVVQGDTVVSTKGTLGFDENDGALVMRYFPDGSGVEEGQTVIAESGDYEVSELKTAEQQAKVMPPIEAYVELGPIGNGDCDCKAELRSINQRLCALNALEYEEELSEVRTIIMRDLKNVAVTYHMDTLLAYKLVGEYEAITPEGADMETVNFNSLKALVHIILGPEPLVDDYESWCEECRPIFEKVRKAGMIAVSDLCIYLDQFDPNIIALQGLSNSETSNVIDPERYMALHALPGVHARLRDLEERMLLLRILNEIGKDIEPVLRKRSPMLTAYNDVTTADTLDDVESSLKSGMKGGKQFDAFPLTRQVLNAEVGGSTPILKYFALERNVHGIMATAVCSEDPQEKEIYQRFYDGLGLGAAGMPKVLQMDERAFLNAPFAISLETACSRNRGLLLKLIERGLLADTSARISIYVLKAFDLLCTYGAELFGMKAPEMQDRFYEDYNDVTEYLPHFYTYVGSFLVSYCPLQDDAVMGEASDADRAITYRSGVGGFVHSTDMSKFSEYDVVDMRTVVSE